MTSFASDEIAVKWLNNKKGKRRFLLSEKQWTFECLYRTIQQLEPGFSHSLIYKDEDDDKIEFCTDIEMHAMLAFFKKSLGRNEVHIETKLTDESEFFPSLMNSPPIIPKQEEHGSSTSTSSNESVHDIPKNTEACQKLVDEESNNDKASTDLEVIEVFSTPRLSRKRKHSGVHSARIEVIKIEDDEDAVEKEVSFESVRKSSGSNIEHEEEAVAKKRCSAVSLWSQRDLNSEAHSSSAYLCFRRHNIFVKEEEEDDAAVFSDHNVHIFEQSPSFITNGEMFDYQVKGLNWLIQLYHHGLNGILADEMGLGKTLQAISMLGYLQQHKGIDGPFLVIAPATMLQHWEDEFLRWCPSIETVILSGDESYRRQALRDNISSHMRTPTAQSSTHDKIGPNTIVHDGVRCNNCKVKPICGTRFRCSNKSCYNYDLCEACERNGVHADTAHLMRRIETPQSVVLITSFEYFLKTMCSRHGGAIQFKKTNWEYVIIDEAHRIKGLKNKLSVAIRSLRSKHRLLLSGTPLQKDLSELWALLNFLLPEKFADFDEFKAMFSATEEEKQNQSRQPAENKFIEHLHRILKPVLLRRLKDDDLKSLLPKKVVNVDVGMSEMQRKLYGNELLKASIDVENGELHKLVAADDLNYNLRILRRCCNHPYLLAGAEPGPPYTTDMHLIENSGKLLLLDKLLPRLKQQNSRVLIFCTAADMLTILEDYCGFRGYKYCRMGAGLQPYHEMINEFNSLGSDYFIFMMTTHTGGFGINLASADVVIMYDSNWNPQLDLQAMDRCHRIGQTKQVRVFRLITKNTVEQRIIEQAEERLRLDSIDVSQGHLADYQKAPKVKEMIAMMIREQDDEIRDQAAFTDQDIDEILARANEVPNLVCKIPNSTQHFSICHDYC